METILILVMAGVAVFALVGMWWTERQVDSLKARLDALERRQAELRAATGR